VSNNRHKHESTSLEEATIFNMRKMAETQWLAREWKPIKK
jgi:hypothetical protein